MENTLQVKRESGPVRSLMSSFNRAVHNRGSARGFANLDLAFGSDPESRCRQRVCVDMRHANEAIIHERFPVPTVEELLYDLILSLLWEMACFRKTVTVGPKTPIYILKVLFVVCHKTH